jgi:hypothetical protein
LESNDNGNSNSNGNGNGNSNGNGKYGDSGCARMTTLEVGRLAW